MRNVNIGVLGHVDSGKTSLVRALSTTLSTAALDKHPESQRRGITLDLGFSCVERINASDERELVTLVDCPGHASLLRAIISGAKIIDAMVLVVDVTKGVQTQTAECIVLAEVTQPRKVVIALSKTDLIDEANCDLMEKRVGKILSKTRIAGADIVKIAAEPREGPPTGLEDLTERLFALIATDGAEDDEAISRKDDSLPSTVVAIDHVFSIRGQGTVMTGTILQGFVRVGMELEFPSVAVGFVRRVKTIQSFRKQLQTASRGARIGFGVEKIDLSFPERLYAVTPPDSMPPAKVLLGTIQSVSYYQAAIRTDDKFHLHIGHTIVMAKLALLSLPEEDSPGRSSKPLAEQRFDYESQLETTHTRRFFVVMELEKPACAVLNDTALGTKLDMDVAAKKCRIAFSSVVLMRLSDRWRSEVRVYHSKTRSGRIDRVASDSEAIVKGLFDKSSKIDPFIGMKTKTATATIDDRDEAAEGDDDNPLRETEVVATIVGTFGKSGKLRLAALPGRSFRPIHEGAEVTLRYKKASLPAPNGSTTSKHFAQF